MTSYEFDDILRADLGFHEVGLHGPRKGIPIELKT